MSTSDLELLARYVRQGAEDAFAEVVRNHAGMVYSVALRVTRVPQLAEDVAQAVFLDLARNAKKLRPDTVLAAWLYAVTRRTAANTVRGETRRLIREQAAYTMNAHEESSPPPAELEPLLDDAMDSLAETDRAAIVLRFFNDKSLADVGAELGVSADAAQKRVSRAVEQMRGFFSQRGIATGSVAVTALLAASSAKAVPAGLTASICATVHSTIPLTTATLIKAATMTTLQKSLVGLTVIASIGVAVRQTHQLSQLSEQLKSSRPSAVVTRSGPSETTGFTPGRPETRTVTAKAVAKFTPALLEAQILALAEMGVGKFGRAKMNELIAAAPVEDIPRLLAMVDEKLPRELRQRFHDAWIERWAAVDAPAAFAYVAGPDKSRVNAHDLDSLFANWVDQDPSAAAAVLDAYTGPTREVVCRSLGHAWLEKDPQAAMAWIMSALPGELTERSVATRQMAQSWAETDPAEAWKWALSLSLPDSAKSQLLLDLGPAAARSSPVEVANEVAKMEPGGEQDEAASQVAAIWAQTDPRAASQWAAQFPDPETRGNAMEGIASHWAEKDPAAARAWIQSLLTGDEQQQALLGFTRGLARQHPEQAADMLKSLTNPDQRKGAIWDIGESWLKTNPAAARQWLLGAGYTEEQIQRNEKDAAGLPDDK